MLAQVDTASIHPMEHLPGHEGTIEAQGTGPYGGRHYQATCTCGFRGTQMATLYADRNAVTRAVDQFLQHIASWREAGL